MPHPSGEMPLSETLKIARYGVTAITAAGSIQMILEDLVIQPFDEKLTAIRAVGVLGRVARDITEIDIF